jgi:hypothetical protein
MHWVTGHAIFLQPWRSLWDHFCARCTAKRSGTQGYFKTATQRRPARSQSLPRSPVLSACFTGACIALRVPALADGWKTKVVGYRLELWIVVLPGQGDRATESASRLRQSAGRRSRTSRVKRDAAPLCHSSSPKSASRRLGDSTKPLPGCKFMNSWGSKVLYTFRIGAYVSEVPTHWASQRFLHYYAGTWPSRKARKNKGLRVLHAELWTSELGTCDWVDCG